MTRKPDMGDDSVDRSLHQLFDDHLSAMTHWEGGVLAAAALRTASLPARALLAHAATRGTGTLDDLLSAAGLRDSARPQDLDIDPHALCDLARVIALQMLLPDDRAVGLALYDLHLQCFGPDRRRQHQNLHAQLTLEAGRRDELEKLVATYDRLSAANREHLALDLRNPFVGHGGDRDVWLQQLARLFPDPPIAIGDEYGTAPFDRVTAMPAEKIHSRNLVSVVVPCYQPTVGLLTAVRSIINQSWASVEIIVVDDASPPAHADVLAACADLDPRVTVIKLPVNGGTYVARNAGLDAASGEFVSFQDADDWSHPARLQHQVEPLVADGSLVATTTDCLRVSENLILNSAGRLSLRLNTSSLLFRKSHVIEEIGYFDEVRKAADSEYLRRIDATFGMAATKHVTGKAYALVRLGSNSLSSDDFRPGWMHPARLAYRSGYGLWHRKIRAGFADPYLAKAPATRPFPAPPRFRVGNQAKVDRDSFDVVLAGDWRRAGWLQHEMIEEIRSLLRHGHRVAIMQLESYRLMARLQLPLCDPIQELINAGTVGQVVPSDDVTTSMLVIRSPLVLQFAGRARSGVRAKRLIVVASYPPTEPESGELRYLPNECAQAAQDIFGVEPTWCPSSHQVRVALTALLSLGKFTTWDMPAIIDSHNWMVPRTGFRSTIPVIGRHSPDTPSRWPADAATLRHAYPESADVDVRIMGGGESAATLLGTPDPPGNWHIFRSDDIDVRSFLFQLDFWVYYPHAGMDQMSERAILEAMASGCVVILPSRFRTTFGAAALYRKPSEIRSTIKEYYEDQAKFLRQSRLGQRHVTQMHGSESYSDLLRRTLSDTLDDDCRVGHEYSAVPAG